MHKKYRGIPSWAKTTKYNLERLQSHWRSVSKEFIANYKDYAITFDSLIQFVSDVLTQLEHKASLAENCTYLLLTKSINHSLAAYSLIERGLIIDGALCARNAVEACLMLQLFILDETGSYFDAWSKDKEFSPGEVRKKLAAVKEIAVKDIIVEFTENDVDAARETYSWLSEITHANLASLRHTVNKITEQQYQVHIGGSIEGQEAIIRAIFQVMCHYLLDTSVISMAILDLSFVEKSKNHIDKLQKNIKSTVTITNKR
jgi:hypothetical protein